MSGTDTVRVKEGYYLRLENLGQPGARNFVMVQKREPAYYEFRANATSTTDNESGAMTVTDLKPLALNEVFQCFFGVGGRGYVFLNLPPNARLWGPGQNPVSNSTIRRIGWVDEDRSPYWCPSPATEFWLMKGGNFEFPTFVVYNPTPRSIRPAINIVVNKLRVSPVTDQGVLSALARGAIPYRPVNFGGIPAERSGPG